VSENHQPHANRRAHTGRRRNEAARDAILESTIELLRRDGTEGLTIDAIAAAAGVGRQTIYRWWPSKGAVVVDALAYHGRAVAPVRDSGSLTADLTAFLEDSFDALEDPGTVRTLRELGAAAQHDEHVSEALRDFTAQRRAALRSLLVKARDRGDIADSADLDMLIDMAYGVLWYRVLISRAPLDKAAADSLAAHLIAAARPR
jgi:AcrR family transcriptional regulator